VPAGPPGPASDDPDLSFDPDDGGDPQVAAAVSEHTTRELELGFTPRDTNLSVSDFCRLRLRPLTGELRTVVTVNGHDFGQGECRTDARAGDSRISHGEDAAANRAGWAALDVRPGERSVIRVRVEGNGGSAILGVGVYELSGPRVTSDGFTIRRRLEAGDHEYSLVGYRTAKITAAVRELELAPIAAERPGWLISGTRGGGEGDDQDAVVRVLLDGVQLSAGAGGGISETQVGTTPRTVSLRVPPGVTGTMVLAYDEQLAPRR